MLTSRTRVAGILTPWYRSEVAQLFFARIESVEELDDTTAISLLNAVWGDSSAGWRQLVQRYTPFIYKYCRAAGLPAEDAADVGQEVLTTVVRSISSFRRDEKGHTFRGWLYTITRNKIIDHFRRNSREPSISIDRVEHQLTAADTMYLQGDAARWSGQLSSPVREIVEAVQSEFEKPTWQAFWRTTVEGQQTANVAEDLGISVNAVYLARSRILKRLRERLDGRLADDTSYPRTP